MVKSTRISAVIILVAVVIVAGVSTPAMAATCNVPSGSHPDIQTAVDDIGCAPIIIAAGTYAGTVVIARTVNLTGAGSDQTYLQGQVQVTSGTVHLSGLHITAPADALWAHSGAEVSGFDLVVLNGDSEPPLFADGFETGGTGAWSAVAP